MDNELFISHTTSDLYDFDETYLKSYMDKVEEDYAICYFDFPVEDRNPWELLRQVGEILTAPVHELNDYFDEIPNLHFYHASTQSIRLNLHKTSSPLSLAYIISALLRYEEDLVEYEQAIIENALTKLTLLGDLEKALSRSLSDEREKHSNPLHVLSTSQSLSPQLKCRRRKHFSFGRYWFGSSPQEPSREFVWHKEFLCLLRAIVGMFSLSRYFVGSIYLKT